ncbi:MAG TPA: phospholipid carrier-dependent glycosyltransferase [Clostridia bacterium]|nr:phospholipid carrier-dependent glycosyltransferase [Clostridia bacterium]
MRRLFAALTVVLLVFAPHVSARAEDELAYNGSFSELNEESALPEGWFFEAWYDTDEDRLVETVATGEKNLVHIANYIENDVRLCQTVSVEPDSYYLLSCDIKAVNVEGGAGANISVRDTFASASSPFNASDFTRVTLAGKTGSDQETLIVCVRLGGYSELSTGDAYFSNFSLVKLNAAPAGEIADFSAVAAQADEGDEVDSDEGKVPYIGPMILSTALFGILFALLYKRFFVRRPLDGGEGEKSAAIELALVLLSAFVFRMLLSFVFYGHPTDIACFMSWSNSMVEYGPSGFYELAGFADYPPGYMYVLWVLGLIARLFNLPYGGAGYALLVKLPAIFADLAAAYIVYKLAKKRFSGKISLLLAALIAFNPTMAFVSGAWGQIDQLLALGLLAVIWLFLDRKIVWAGLVYGLVILLKPQALMAGPLIAVAYFAYLHDFGFKNILKLLTAVIGALAVIVLFALPFTGNQEPFWLLDKYFSTATSYPYASVEAFNLLALLGGNWKSVDSTLFIFSYKTWGTIFILLSVAYASVLYLKGRKSEPHALTLSAAFLIAALFTFGQYMHERYLFPALLLLLVAFIQFKDKRLLGVYGFLSVSMLLNVLAAFVIVDHQYARGTEYDALSLAGSVLNVAGFIYLAVVCTKILVKGNISEAQTGEPLIKASELQRPEEKQRFRRLDYLLCWGLTAVYAVVALVNLGTLQAPQTVWTGQRNDMVELSLPGETALGDIRVYGGLYDGAISVTASDGTTLSYQEENGDMFRWKSIGGEEITADSITLTVTSGKVWFNEIAVFDAEGNYVPLIASVGGETLVDEPDQVPEKGSYLNGMYFDELYHARTAYEHLNGIKPYENSHPPLGKVFIMLGIAIFGMNAFGWRIVGTVFGIFMVPIFYLFAKQLFKKTEYAFLAAGLFAFDFMHFAQTRIATIDVYGVFFILLMFYFMYRYYTMNFHAEPLKKTLWPLALSGVFFGLGAASKWICIYAGGGLAVIFFTSLTQRFLEYRRFKNSGDPALCEAVADFWSKALKTLLWCILFFIVIPVGIYLLSYLPYYLASEPYDLKGVWDVQKFMFSYHSNLKATHPYESPWWQWPLDIRPIWYYVGYNVAEGNISTISSFGNPAVWVVSLFGAAALSVKLLRGKVKYEKGMFVLIVGACANYLPWVLVTRCTFIYHYFATVPFILLLTVYLIKDMDERKPHLRYVKWAWLTVAVLLFALFYPALSGVEVSKNYISMLEWLPSWTFLGY